MTTMLSRLGANAVAKIFLGYSGMGLALVMAMAVVGGPEWSVPLLAGSLILLLPFVLVLAWALDCRQFQGRRPRD
ncbi:MAG: hypothetical protein KY453_08640 [Gemmatimonadetes bacterium]|nr:hypothetical protein [Gemmatimonadota bacterium]